MKTITIKELKKLKKCQLKKIIQRYDKINEIYGEIGALFESIKYCISRIGDEKVPDYMTIEDSDGNTYKITIEEVDHD